VKNQKTQVQNATLGHAAGRASSTAQADSFAGAKEEEKASACSARNESGGGVDCIGVSVSSLGHHRDTRHWMNFIPLTVKSILHKASDNADMRTHGRQ
jgi:hypothetical protein